MAAMDGSVLGPPPDAAGFGLASTPVAGTTAAPSDGNAYVPIPVNSSAIPATNRSVLHAAPSVPRTVRCPGLAVVYLTMRQDVVDDSRGDAPVAAAGR